MDDEPALLHVEQMGISQLLVFENKADAEQFRLLMRENEGRVGPLFQPAGWDGRIGFFNYSRRLLATVLRENPRYQVVGSSTVSSTAPAKCR